MTCAEDDEEELTVEGGISRGRGMSRLTHCHPLSFNTFRDSAALFVGNLRRDTSCSGNINKKKTVSLTYSK